MDVDLDKAFLDNALRYYTDPPMNGDLQIGARDPSLLFQLADKIYEHTQATRKRRDPIVRPGNKPELFLRWAYNRKGLTVNFELEAAENKVGLTVLGTF